MVVRMKSESFNHKVIFYEVKEVCTVHFYPLYHWFSTKIESVKIGSAYLY